MDEFSENLISKVRVQQHLYDTQHKEYKNLILKEQSWAKIGEELKMSPLKVKTRWKNLRDSYVKYRNQLNKVTDDAGKEALNNRFSKWTSRPYLSFLDETLSRRSESVTQVPTKLERRSPPAKRTRTIPDENIRETKRIDFSKVNRNGENKLHSFSNDFSNKTRSEKSFKNEKQRNEDDANDSSESNTMEFEIPKMQTENCLEISTTNGMVANEKSNALLSKTTNEGDAIDLLFGSYAKTFRALPLVQQVYVKIEMAKLFANAEIQSQTKKK